MDGWATLVKSAGAQSGEKGHGMRWFVKTAWRLREFMDEEVIVVLEAYERHGHVVKELMVLGHRLRVASSSRGEFPNPHGLTEQ